MLHFKVMYSNLSSFKYLRFLIDYSFFQASYSVTRKESEAAAVLLFQSFMSSRVFLLLLKENLLLLLLCRRMTTAMFSTCTFSMPSLSGYCIPWSIEGHHTLFPVDYLKNAGNYCHRSVTHSQGLIVVSVPKVCLEMGKKGFRYAAPAGGFGSEGTDLCKSG